MIALTCPNFVKKKTTGIFLEDREATSFSHKIQTPQSTSRRQTAPVQAARLSRKTALLLITNGFVSLQTGGRIHSKVYLLQ